MRVMILFDTSGSMRQNDPHRLSLAAAHLFLTLVRAQDVVGLVAFSDRAIPLVPMTPLASPLTKDQLRTRLTTLQFTGQTTDLAAALAAGLTGFPSPAGATGRDIVLLLTDGKLDLGAARRAEEPGVLASIRQTLLPQYRQRGIALYTIAFSAEADQALLQDMAQSTGGAFRFIDQAALLHQAFGDLFILARQAEALPLQDNAFLLDDSLQEATLVLTKQEAQEQIRLRTPQQQLVSAQHPSPGVTWTSTPAYEMVQIADPTPGIWQIERPVHADGSVGIVGSSALQLQVEIQPAYREAGETVRLRAFLEEQGQRLRDPQQLQPLAVHAEVTPPAGRAFSLPLAPQEDGVFAAPIHTLREPGQYGLRVTVTGPQLRRQRALSFTIHSPCFQPAVLAGAPVTVQVTLADTCPAFPSLVFEAGRSVGNRPPTWIPLALTQPGVFATALPPLVPGQTGTVTLRIRGRLEGEEAFLLLKGPWLLPAPPPASETAAQPAETSSQTPEVSWQVITQFFVTKLVFFNAVLVLAGGSGYGLYYYLKWRRNVPYV
jgi:hypothetical protein